MFKICSLFYKTEQNGTFYPNHECIKISVYILRIKGEKDEKDDRPPSVKHELIMLSKCHNAYDVSS